jgi:nitroimidazol reductase NimA-like FMN-containing flavoprotein (pyridoxamine 5'-phosphate oxidase superfamily)
MKSPEYHMVKRKLEITDLTELKGILAAGRTMTLGLCRTDEPYIVTLSYGFCPAESCVYFHCANRGLKLEFLADNPRVCGTVVQDLGYVTGRCSHRFRSVVFWGTARRIREPAGIRRGYEVMIDQLEAEPRKVKKRLLQSPFDLKKAFLFRVDIDRISGKSGGSG